MTIGRRRGFADALLFTPPRPSMLGPPPQMAPAA